MYDVVVIGSGPNGLSGGIYFAEKGFKVLIVEALETIGGGMRTESLTLPGFKHDVCSAVHPMGYLSPYFKTLPLQNFGLEWIIPEASVAHPLDDEEAVILTKSLNTTAQNLSDDNENYKRILNPYLKNWEVLLSDSLQPFKFPDSPLLLAKFGLKAFQSASYFANHNFKSERTRALFAGCAAHSVLPLQKYFTAAMGLMFLITGHVENWAIPKGGSISIANSLGNYFESLGGEFLMGNRITSFNQLPQAKKYLFDTDPIQLAQIAENHLPSSYKKRLKRYNYGPGIFKMDFALADKIPWLDKNCWKASTVHLGGTLEEIEKSEKDAWMGLHNNRPFVFVAQQSLFDETRAPNGKHTCWAYCHVPYASEKDMSSQIINQIERFAPGFKDLILAKKVMTSIDFYNYNPNYLGGAVTGGAASANQLFTRPVARINPYSTPNKDIYICSASTPPGGGVHGMCGYNAARSILKTM